MDGQDLSQPWAFDNTVVHDLAVEWRSLEATRKSIEQRQRELARTALSARIALAVEIDAMTADSLTRVLDDYAGKLRASMAWEGRLASTVVNLWANDMHGSHQACGRPWCWIGGVAQLAWRGGESPLISTEAVQEHGVRLGMVGSAWRSQLQERTGISLVVDSLTGPGQGHISIWE